MIRGTYQTFRKIDDGQPTNLHDIHKFYLQPIVFGFFGGGGGARDWL